MYRFSFKAFLFILFLQIQVFAHDVALPVIVDTDMALDDIRAITMLLNSEVANVPLFIVSDGVRAPEEGIKNLKALLNYFEMGEISVVKGKELGLTVPPVRRYIKSINVPGSEKISGVGAEKSPAPDAIVSVLKGMDEPVIYLCLGPLTSLSAALEIDPATVRKISRIVYYGCAPDSEDPGWNTLRDPEAARKVFSSGIKIQSISLPEKRLLPFNNALYKKAITQGTRASGLIEMVHETETIKKMLGEGHFYVWDEMTVIYFNDPSLFSFEPSQANKDVMVLRDINRKGLESAYLKALGLPGDFHLETREAVVFTGIPQDPSMFQEDVRPAVNQLINMYGIEEWKACLLTNEFHRHLGIYSIAGAKMGVRAREILEAPFDSLEVISNAGNNPPLSCMNDGLQVSTGASLGRGAIRVTEGNTPSAQFLYKDLKLTLTLKKEVWGKIKNDIGMLVSKYGGTTPEYFKKVRELSIVYWKDLDRALIFDEKMEKRLTGVE
ncbi:MAG: nucleoside hydrolase [Deltaproteobacteria bacterium]|nr:nucleoside hydrolase [Deltaproteobacteria bacterium]